MEGSGNCGSVASAAAELVVVGLVVVELVSTEVALKLVDVVLVAGVTS